jgi:hypothetical protein
MPLSELDWLDLGSAHQPDMVERSDTEIGVRTRLFRSRHRAPYRQPVVTVFPPGVLHPDITSRHCFIPRTGFKRIWRDMALFWWQDGMWRKIRALVQMNRRQERHLTLIIRRQGCVTERDLEHRLLRDVLVFMRGIIRRVVSVLRCVVWNLSILPM